MKEKKNSVFRIGRIVILIIVVLIVFPLIPMIISGSWNWWQAWVFAGLIVVTFIISRLLAARHSPDIIKERADFLGKKDTKPYRCTIICPTK